MQKKIYISPFSISHVPIIIKTKKTSVVPIEVDYNEQPEEEEEYDEPIHQTETYDEVDEVDEEEESCSMCDEEEDEY